MTDDALVSILAHVSSWDMKAFLRVCPENGRAALQQGRVLSFWSLCSFVLTVAGSLERVQVESLPDGTARVVAPGAQSLPPTEAVGAVSRATLHGPRQGSSIFYPRRPSPPERGGSLYATHASLRPGERPGLLLSR